VIHEVGEGQLADKHFSFQTEKVCGREVCLNNEGIDVEGEIPDWCKFIEHGQSVPRLGHIDLRLSELVVLLLQLDLVSLSFVDERPQVTHCI